MQKATVYGIPNCDSVKKGITWLQNNGFEVTLFNFKKEPVTTAMLQRWQQAVTHTPLLNKKSTAYKNLSEADQLAVNNEATTFKIIQQNPLLIKRPVIEVGKKVAIGFDETLYQSIFLT